MTPLDFINKERQKNNTVSVTDVISAHQKAGTLNQTVKFYQPAPGTKPAPKPVVPPPDQGFFERTSESFRGLMNNDFSLGDVAREIPGEAKRQVVGISNYVAPAITNFFKTTGSIFGEGLAYALDENVRKEYQAGNLDILPTITETTVPKLAKYTFAAGLETAIFRSLPNVAKMSLAKIGGVSALEGIGFAISEGLAKDESPEEIIKKMPLYGGTGLALGILSPYLLPLLKTELKFAPKKMREMFSNIEDEIVKQRELKVASEFPDSTAVPISTPNTRYQQYLRSQGYEPYIPESKLPTIEAGGATKKAAMPTVEPGKTPPKVFDGTNTPEPAFTEMVPEPKQTTISPESSMTAPAKASPAPRTESKVAEGIPEVTSAPRETVSVPSSQLPVTSAGKERVSRLEQRMVKATESPEANFLQGEKRATYQQVSKKEQIQKAAAYVEKNPEDAMAVLRGDKMAPDGILDNSIALAMAKRAELDGDAALAVRLASLRSTRAGQEISMLTEAEPDSIVSAIESVIQARKGRAVRRAKGETVSTEKVVKEAKQVVTGARLKISEAQKILNDILC